jgi:beta-glucosidase
MTFIDILLYIVLFVAIFFVARYMLSQAKTMRNIKLLGPEAPELTIDGFTFRDLNMNGELDLYEDTRLPIEDRVEDLLSQMTLEEKAGMMFHPQIGMNDDGTLVERRGRHNRAATSEMVAAWKINHYNVYQIAPPKQAAIWYNRIQKLAERTRLGIPVTISSDPRHAFSDVPGTSIFTKGFSHWPEPIGLAATGDPGLVQEFGDIARQEYLAVGIRTALHPMSDLATEPRWARVNGTFGEDAKLSAKMTAAYVRGFQGETMGPESVACMTKHFPGGGPQKDGEDAHFSYGKDQIYPGDNFDYHLIPFETAFEAGTSQIMPYYGRPLGTHFEEVGFGYNKDVITGLLREKYGFDGIVCTDWTLVTDFKLLGRMVMEARAWGVEKLTKPERIQKIIEAGCDQFGGEFCPEVVVKLVQDGEISEEQIDESARRILREKFRMGLFDNPYVDEDAVEERVGRPEFIAAGELAQRKSIVLLKNTETYQEFTLPIKGKPRLYLEGFYDDVAGQFGEEVSTPEEADFAILRLNTPFTPRKGFLERFFHAGQLNFDEAEKNHIVEICEKVPTIIDIYLERPAVIPEIAEKCAGLLGNFGANDGAVLDVIFGEFNPTGKLPIELPSSMEAVENQKEDLPYDSENPLFPFGFGLTY